MEIEFHPAVSLFEETFNIRIALVELLAEALNSRLDCSITELRSAAPSPPSSS